MFHSNRVVALVPIKEHSERLKEKNFRDFVGRPLYHHILATLDKTNAVDEVVIDTDSKQIMREAPTLSPKITVLERPASLRGDRVSMNKIVGHDLTKTGGDIYIQTHATNPLLRGETIVNALRAFADHEQCDSLFSVTRYQSRFYTHDGKPINHDPSDLIRTQDLAPVLEENSCLYVFTKQSFARTSARIGINPFLFETPRLESVDIDDEVAWRLAEIIAAYAHLSY